MIPPFPAFLPQIFSADRHSGIPDSECPSYGDLYLCSVVLLYCCTVPGYLDTKYSFPLKNMRH